MILRKNGKNNENSRNSREKMQKMSNEKINFAKLFEKSEKISDKKFKLNFAKISVFTVFIFSFSLCAWQNFANQNQNFANAIDENSQISLSQNQSSISGGEILTISGKGFCANSDVLECYAKNGLVAELDAKKNTKNGHDNSAETWEDLVGNHDANLANSTWSDKSLRMTNSNYAVNFSNLTFPSFGDFSFESVFSGEVCDNSAKSNPKIFEMIGSHHFVFEHKSTAAGDGNCNYDLAISNNSKYHWIFTDNNSSDAQTFSVQRNSATAKISIDGAENVKDENFFASTDDIPQANLRLFFGDFTGEVSQIRLYNRALTEEETAANAHVDLCRYLNPNDESCQISVEIGGAKCKNVQVISDEKITCEIPAHAAEKVNLSLNLGGKILSAPFEYVDFSAENPENNSGNSSENSENSAKIIAPNTGFFAKNT